MKIGLVILIIVVLALLLVGGKFIGIRNDLATKREAINASWAQIEADLQRRADLVPNLVGTVKAYAKEETSVVDSITKARAQLLNAKSPEEKIAANSSLDNALGRLLVVVENYPNLKASQNFQSLQFQLEGTENRILQSRRKYNDAVKEYNTELQLFPQNVVASISGFQPNNAYFRTEPGARRRRCLRQFQWTACIAQPIYDRRRRELRSGRLGQHQHSAFSRFDCRVSRAHIQLRRGVRPFVRWNHDYGFQIRDKAASRIRLGVLA
jgi:LemA protein